MPSHCAAQFAGIALPGVTTRFTGLGHGLSAPNFFASGLVQRDNGATHTVLTAAESCNHQIFHQRGWRRDYRARCVVNDHRFPQLFARFGIQRNHMRIKATQENLAIGMGHAAVVHVTASVLVDAFWNIRLVSPLYLAGFGVHRKSVFGTEGGSDKQRVTHQNRCRFLRARRTQLKRPLNPQVFDIARVDLCRGAEPGVASITSVNRPILRSGAGACAQCQTQNDWGK